MATVLVTGAAGFIGSHTCEAFLYRGYRVIGLDNFNDFYDPQIKRKNMAEIEKTASQTKGRFFLCEGDIRNASFLDGVLARYKPEAVIHLAAYAGVRPSIEQPLLYTDVNINGTVNLLEQMRIHHIKRHVFASSSSVYGNNMKIPFHESDPVDRAISPYAATKKAGEVIGHTYHHLYGINTACLRFFTVYGPRQRPDLAIHKFTKLMTAGKPISLYGDGSTRRDYTYIEDIVDGVVKAFEWTDSAEKRYDIFNLGESQTVSLIALVQTLSGLLGIEPVMQWQPPQPGDVEQTYADITHARTVLGYAPKTTLQEGLARFVAWYAENYGLK